MKTIHSALVIAALALTAIPAVAAKPMSDQQRLRAQAEHDCYADVQKLCPNDISDEEKVKGCMEAHHAQLSPQCAKDFDAGMKM